MSLTDPLQPGMDPKPTQETPPKTSTKSEEPKGSFQDRLNQLTRRASDAERVAAQSIAENSELRSQLSRMEAQIARLSESRPTPASEYTSDLSGNDKSGSLDSLAKQIKEEVLGAVRPLLDEFAQNKANTQLAATQQQSFDRAAQVHKDLRNPESELFKTFSQLWNARPDLQRVEGSPELIAEAARGLLSESHATEQVRKMAAAADTPRNPRKLDTIDDTKDINSAVKSLVDIGKTDGWGSDDMEDYLSLKFKAAGLI